MIKILTEGGSKKGLGHIFRCITIAEEFDAQIIVDSDICTGLTSLYKNMIFDSWQEEEWILTNIVKVDVVFVDSYHITFEQLELIRNLSQKVIVIDDLFRFDYKNYNIINPNNFGDEINYDASNNVFAGNKYMLIRKEFAGYSKKSVSKKVRNVFVVFGGTDVLNLVPKMIDYINERQSFNDVMFHIVTQRPYEDTDKIKFYSMLSGYKMRELMLLADFVVTAGGQTINELIRLAVPFACIEVVKNQRINIDGALKKKYCIEFNELEFNKIDKMFLYNVRYSLYNSMKRDYYKESGAYYLKTKLLDCYEHCK